MRDQEEPGLAAFLNKKRQEGKSLLAILGKVENDSSAVRLRSLLRKQDHILLNMKVRLFTYSDRRKRPPFKGDAGYVLTPSAVSTEVPVRNNIGGVFNTTIPSFRATVNQETEKKRSSAGFSPAEEENSHGLFVRTVENPPKSGNASLMRAAMSKVLPFEHPSRMEKMARTYHNLQTQIESLFLKHKQAKNVKQAHEISTKISKVYEELKKMADMYYREFGRVIGFGNLQGGYKKNVFDDQMESCFGSMDKEGISEFTLNGITRRIENVRDANMVFSLYLGRKCLCPKTLADFIMAENGFFDRVCYEADPHPGFGEIFDLFKTVVQSVISEDKIKKYEKTERDVAPLHSSSCVENPRSKGGKREIYYSQKIRISDEVEVIAIYTGGKIRVITIDSAYNLKYAWLNKLMAKCVREHNWSVFGAEVSEFVKKNPGFLEGNEWIISGDLESATDLFRGEFADYVIHWLVQNIDEFDESDEFQMRAFTTHANFGSDPNFPGGKKIQKRGQLMGSILSFPILCLVSLTAAIYGTRQDAFLLQNPKRNIKKLKNIGVNGDDVVFKSSDRGDRWTYAVEAIGGKVSRGKSIVNRDVFTVNSELWCRFDGVWHPPQSVRPSLILGIQDGRKSKPDNLWLEYARWIGDQPDPFGVEKKLKANIPTKWGGLGRKRNFDRSAIVSYFESKVKKIRKTRVPPPFQKEFDTLMEERKKEKKIKVMIDKEKSKKIMAEWQSQIAHIPHWTEKEEETPVHTAMVLDQLKWMTQSERDLIESIYHELIDEGVKGNVVRLLPSKLVTAYAPEARVYKEKVLNGCFGEKKINFNFAEPRFVRQDNELKPEAGEEIKENHVRVPLWSGAEIQALTEGRNAVQGRILDPVDDLVAEFVRI